MRRTTDVRYAENHHFPVVRWKGRRGGEPLHVNLQELEDSERESLWGGGTGPQGDRDDGPIPARGSAVHRPERRPTVQVHGGDLVCRLLLEKKKQKEESEAIE